jgi:hypothetical protein
LLVNAGGTKTLPLSYIMAYYYYAQHDLYKRCNPTGTVCDNAFVIFGNPPPYGLFQGGEINILGTSFCAMSLFDDTDDKEIP